MAERPKGDDMREVKFRAWGKSGVMRQWEDLQSLHIHTLFNMCQPDVILMQYTGLKDKNGVEIYEGDLLDHPYFDDPIAVEWNADDACFESSGVVSEWASCEVVGNIYEKQSY